MVRIQKSVLVHAPIEKVFDYLNDPHKLTEYWPGMVEVKDIQSLSNGGTCFKYVYKMAGFRFEGKSEDTEIIPLKRMVSVTTGGVEGKVTWELEKAADGIKVLLDSEYTVPLPVVGRVAEAVIVKLNEHEAELILMNLKIIMETKRTA